MQNLNLPVSEPNRDVIVHHDAAPSAPLRFQLVDPLDSDSEGGFDSTNILDYWHVLRRHTHAIILISFLGALAGLLTSLPQTPVYQASTSLEIQGLNENFLNMANVNPTTTGAFLSPEIDIQTQARILQSGALMERVQAKLQRTQRSGPPPQPSRLAAWRKALGLGKPGQVSADPQAPAMPGVGTVVHTSPQTRIIEISADSTDPEFAAEYANTLANEFIEQNMEGRWTSTQRTGEWLTRQMEDIKIKLEKSEDELQRYAQSSGLMFTGEKSNVAEEKLRQLQEELSKAQSDRVSKQSEYETANSSPPDSLPAVLESATLSDYQAKLTELQRQLIELGSSLTPAHPKIKRTEAQVAELESVMKKERGNILRRIRNEYESAQRRENLLSAAYASQAQLVTEQAAKAIHYNILKRGVDTNRQLYDSMLQRVKEAGVASAMRASNIRVIDPAKPPLAPYKPNLMRDTAVGLLSGVLLGILFVLMRERSDRSLRAPGDAAFYLKMPELGVIPTTGAPKSVYGGRHLGNGKGGSLLPAPQSRQPSNGSKDAEQAIALSKNGNRDQVELATWQHKPSMLAESFRTTLASILFSGQNGSSPRMIVLTSPSPSEGKTTVVSNLAIALAEINYRVLLIDADMRRPRLHAVFDVANTWGLSDLLREKNSLEDCPREALVRETAIPNLYVLPSGPGTVSISNLLYSTRLPELLRRVRREFDMVLIDTPPMLQISDARVLGRLADAVVLVIRAGSTSRDMAVSAKQRFADDGTRILGTILNHWDPLRTQNGYYGHYNHYYDHYYRDDDRS